jgi:uncharacterized protein YqhQ
VSALARADAAGSLPTLGGMARPDGVVIVSERYWAFAGADGTVREGRMPQASVRAQRIPFVRGLVRLLVALSPLFRSTGVARPRERWLLAVAVTAPFALVLLPDRVASLGEVSLTVVLVAWLLRGRTLFLHGAEHRAIMAAEQRRLTATWDGHTHPTRFAPRCGTNFAALVLPIAVVLDRLWPGPPAVYAPFLVAVLALALTMELWRVIQSGRSWRRVFLFPGLALQRLTTREPRLGETQVALTALASVLRRELDLPRTA